MQDFENAGFKLFTQMHRGQQRGWKKYERVGCCTVEHCSYGEILEQFVPLIKVKPSTFLPPLLLLAAFWIFLLVLLNTYIADFMFRVFFFFPEVSHIEKTCQMNHLYVERR